MITSTPGLRFNVTSVGLESLNIIENLVVANVQNFNFSSKFLPLYFPKSENVISSITLMPPIVKFSSFLSL